MTRTSGFFSWALNFSFSMLSLLMPTSSKYKYHLLFTASSKRAHIQSITNNRHSISIMGNHHAFTLLFFSLLLSSALSVERCHPDDKKALFRIKKAFNNAYEFISWTRHSDCCDWNSVECDERTHRIISLSVIDDNEVAGPIPDAVGDLPYLQYLRFHNLPKLVGPIPQAIARLKYLRSLWITHTNITGPVPDCLGQLTELYEILLSVNKLTGTIPPSLSNLHKLQGIFLDRNQLTGSIPDSFGGLKNNKEFYLKLAKNQLSGPLPKSLGAVDFRVIDLSRNQFTGDASFLFGESKLLQNIDLSRNQFSFDISEVVIPKDVYILDLSHNKIYGTLPPSLAQLSNLQQFNVSYNRLCGPTPTAGNLGRFDTYCYAHNKCLCGSPLPPCP